MPSETTATDIITYIGIPLAVLGVLPILYTFFISILRQRRIRHLLHAYGHRPHTTQQVGFVLRASPMTSLIEVEVPRYTIAPVDRSQEEYWEISEEGKRWAQNWERSALGHGHGHGHELQRLSMSHSHSHSRSQSRSNADARAVERVESTLSMVEEGRVRGFLKGGSWRTFHWRRLVVGRKMYRIQYEDELREPPAEIEFADLVNFLMDWGAELDGMGWEKLRSGGLWTPAGTVLLRVRDEEETDTERVSKKSDVNGGDWVLRTSMPDDSDGVLTLCCRWPPGRNYGSSRNATCLPPGWGRLYKPIMIDQDLDDEDPSKSSKKTLSATIAALANDNKQLLDSTSLRFKLESNLVTSTHPESSQRETGFTLPLFRMSKFSLGQAWFTSGVSSLLTLTKSSGSLWGYEPPSEISSFIRKESIPCGVLVILGMLNPDQAPHWDNSSVGLDDDRTLAMNHQKRWQARMQAERLEATMPPEQAKVHRANREMEERRQQMEQMNQHLAAKRLRDQKRMQDALVSPRMGCRAVADLCLAWLVERGDVPRESTVESVAEAVLYLLVVQSQVKESEEGGGGDETMPVLKVLEEWTGWAVVGGMKREQLEMLEEYKMELCYAACVAAVVHEASSVTGGRGKASVDMLECLRLWRKVRLG